MLVYTQYSASLVLVHHQNVDAHQGLVEGLVFGAKQTAADTTVLTL